MRSALLVSLLLAGPLAVLTESPQDLGITADVMAADEECPTNAAPGCALNALQSRAQKMAAADDYPVTKMSASAQDSELETEEPESFVELDEETLDEPESFVELDEEKLEEPESFEELDEETDEETLEDYEDPEESDEEPDEETGQETDEETDEEPEETEALVELDEEKLEDTIFIRRRRSSDSDSGSSSTRRRRGSNSVSSFSSGFSRRRGSSGSNNKCCKCKDGSTVWSQSGKCTPCHQSGIFKTLKPPAKCREGSSSWKGKNPKTGRGDPSWPKHCVKECQKLLVSYQPSNYGGSSSNQRRRGGSGNNSPGVSATSCNQKTGGTCRFMGCAKSRGPGVKCVKGKCVCQDGYCASATGSKGKCMPR